MIGKSMPYRCNCGGKLYVQETRASDEAIYRTRKCRDCGWLFATKEQAIEESIPTNVRDPRIGQRVRLTKETADDGAGT